MARFVIALLVPLLFLPGAAGAALVPTVSVPTAISAKPSYQTPGQAVVLKALANVEKGAYTYRWEVNGNLAGEEIDLDTITVFAGNAGTETRITLELLDRLGATRGGAEYVIAPGDVDLVWEGLTFTPSFYPGRPLPNRESSIVIQAIPHLVQDGKEINAKDLVYQWETEGKKLESLSGYGKSVVRIPVTKFAYATKVTLTVSSRDTGLAAKKTISIPHQSPLLMLYQMRPLAGLWTASGVPSSVPFSGEEMSFRAVPFFVNNPESLSYQWSLAGEPLEAQEDDPALVTFRKTGDGGGLFTVSVIADTPGSVFGRMQSAFGLSFDN